ncbi:hypothetical protein CY34DRAFT_799735 [Suillus luteus UH-Slu-Lm8-n1]|uniref:Uncharacterized protein n=1 Tax=Suillus luteus UH-Slu-Lm8-n1 TaxID=930992 RepID=A0A0D0AA16_9AGAM|nr:hypothetical protein CY34DRAFT_799735 [Suillus luteus UH-Slu-Lm8-n1]
MSNYLYTFLESSGWRPSSCRETKRGLITQEEKLVSKIVPFATFHGMEKGTTSSGNNFLGQNTSSRLHLPRAHRHERRSIANKVKG